MPIREVYLINTSHVDITWWNTPALCLERIAEVIESAIQLAESDPQFRFSIENVFSVRHFLQLRPELESRLKLLLESGRIDVGGLYVAPVSDYSFDEALFRNFALGKQWLLERLGHDTPLAREEDSPGHTLQTPQLCRGFGMRFLRFSRGPMRLFRLRGPDGSEILCFCAGYSWAYDHRLGKTTDDKWRLGFPLRLRQARDAGYANTALMLPDGDDNALPNPEGPRLVDEWNRHRHEPVFRTATVTDFFRRVEDGAIRTFTGDIPNTWAQIAVFEPDVFDVIRDIRRTLPLAELLQSFQRIDGSNVDTSSLEPVWRTLLETLDHNWGGRFQGAWGLEGDLWKLKRIIEARSALNEITSSLVQDFSNRLPSRPDALTISVFNSLSCTRSEPAQFTLDTAKYPQLKDTPVTVLEPEGAPCAVQEIEAENGRRNFVLLAPNVPACGYKTFHASPGTTDIFPPTIIQRNFALENAHYRIDVAPRGQFIQSIRDKEFGRDVLSDASGRMLDLFGIHFHFNEVWAMGFRFDAAPEGFYDNPKNEGKVGEKAVVTGEIIPAGECEGEILPGADGPVFSSIRSRARFLGGAVDQEIRLFNGIRRIDLRTVVHWEGAENYLVCLALPFGPTQGEMTMDVPFGAHRFGDEVPGFWGKIKPPDDVMKQVAGLLPGNAKEWLRRNLLQGGNPFLAQIKDLLSQMLLKEDTTLFRGLYNWLDISLPDWGATLLTRHAPFDFTFGPNAALFASVRNSAFFNGDHYLRRGSHEYTYTLTSHRGDWKSSDAAQWGRAANAPLRAFVADAPGAPALPAASSIVCCNEPNIVLTALKPGPEPGEIIARLYETFGQRTTAHLWSCFPIRAAVLCDMMDRELDPLPIDGDVVSVPFDPCRIVNVKLRFS